MVRRANLSGYVPEAPGPRITTHSAGQANLPTYPAPCKLPAPACQTAGSSLPWRGRTFSPLFQVVANVQRAMARAM